MLRGPARQFRAASSWQEELAGIFRQVEEWLSEDGTPVSIGVAVPERRLMPEVENYLKDHGVDAAQIGADGPRKPDAVHVGTLHRFKGLEYQRMIVAGVSDGVIPAARVEGLRDSDPLRYRAGDQAGTFPAVRRGHPGTRLADDLLARPAQPVPAAGACGTARLMRVILERYALTKPIGSGGMGTLWEGTDVRLNRKIAVKQIRRDLSQDYAAMRRFNREAQITARLSHPGVPVIYDFGADGEELFIAMEYVDGVTIAQLIDEVVPVPIGWAAAIVAQVCAVLAAAHEQQLVHRDLKPANVMIGPDGSVKVLDFGLAAALDPGEFSLITQVGETPGTAFYIAPEVASGERATPASDLYSVGCLLYELLTGTVVFAGLDPVAEIEAHLSKPPPLASAFRSEIPTDLDLLARELLAKSPFGRPPNASAVVERLLPLVADLPPLPDIVEPSAGLTPAQLYSLLQPRLAVVAAGASACLVNSYDASREERSPADVGRNPHAFS